VHPAPDRALSDGAQSLYPRQFASLVDELRPIASAIGRSLAAPPVRPQRIAPELVG
jgi:3-deoxy-7-phosphoheptulonate synthase